MLDFEKACTSSLSAIAGEQGRIICLQRECCWQIGICLSVVGAYEGSSAGAQAELLELNADAADGAIQAVLAALAGGLTWAEVRPSHAPLASGQLPRGLPSASCVHCVPEGRRWRSPHPAKALLKHVLMVSLLMALNHSSAQAVPCLTLSLRCHVCQEQAPRMPDLHKHKGRFDIGVWD